VNAAVQPAHAVVLPRIELGPDLAAHVVRWGQVERCLLRPGDRLVPAPPTAALVLLVPRGRGRPMVGLRRGARLLALPGRVPASPDRWQVASGIQAVERGLERGAPGSGAWHVRVRVGAAAGGAAAGLTGGYLDARQLDALCIRATVVARRSGGDVAIAAANSATEAERLLADTPSGCLRFELALDSTLEPAGQVISGPWPGTRPLASAPARTAAAVGPSTALPVPARGAVAATAASGQVPLPFGFDTRTTA